MLATKREPSDDSERPLKRAKHQNGDVFGLGSDLDLEAFQKEALYRELGSYKRQWAAASSQVTQLTQQVSQIESAYAASRSSWTALLDALNLPSSDGQEYTLPDWSQFSSLDDYAASLSQLAQKTERTITSLIEQSSTSERGYELSKLSSTVAHLTVSFASSKEAIVLLESRLKAAQKDLDDTQAALIRAEKQVDRSRSKTLAQLQARTTTASANSPHPTQPASGPQSPLVPAVPEKDRAPVESKPDPKAEHAVLIDATEFSEVQQLAASRLSEIELLRAQKVSLLLEMDNLRRRLGHIPEDVIRDSALYRSLKVELDAVQRDADSALIELQEVSKEAEGLSSLQIEWRENVLREANQQLEELSRRLAAKDADINRIRNMREQLRAENAELQARDVEKLQSVDQVRMLANAREDRLTALKSELRRLRMKLAASRGDMEGVELESIGEPEEQIANLRAALKSANAQLEVQKAQLQDYASSLKDGNGEKLIESESAARQSVLLLEQRVNELEQLYGSGDHVDTKHLAEQLAKKEERIKTLQTQVKAQEQAASMLLTEVDRLSAAWQTLDSQNRDKVLQLIQYEEKLNRLITEKSKADNKYFAAMRAKEALQQENARIGKTLEKQAKAVEALTEHKTALSAQLTAVEKELSLMKESLSIYRTKYASAEIERDELNRTKQSLLTQVIELTSTLGERTTATEQAISAKKRLEEQLARLQRQVQRAEANKDGNENGITKPASLNANVSSLEAENANLTKLLKCSSCQIRFKSHVITRCYHLLCHECIEQRLQLRQRKCPTCQMAFGAADVAQVYF